MFEQQLKHEGRICPSIQLQENKNKYSRKTNLLSISINENQAASRIGTNIQLFILEQQRIGSKVNTINSVFPSISLPLPAGVTTQSFPSYSLHSNCLSPNLNNISQNFLQNNPQIPISREVSQRTIDTPFVLFGCSSSRGLFCQFIFLSILKFQARRRISNGHGDVAVSPPPNRSVPEGKNQARECTFLQKCAGRPSNANNYNYRFQTISIYYLSLIEQVRDG